MQYEPHEKQTVRRDASPIYESTAPEDMSVGRYIATRIPTLKPPMAKTPNPIKLLATLNLQQWLFFFVSLFRPLPTHSSS